MSTYTEKHKAYYEANKHKLNEENTKEVYTRIGTNLDGTFKSKHI